MTQFLKFIITGSALCLCYITRAQDTPQQKGLQTINRATAEAHIGFLADDALRGREAGSQEGRVAGVYLASYLQTLGLKPLFDSYYQPFEVYRAERQQKKPFQVHPDSVAMLRKGVHQKLAMRNVLARIEGKRRDEIVIIGAHYDHLGYDPHLDGDQIYNGADDNASGVAALLQIARAFLATGVQPERTVIFALWDGEEKGLLGSAYFTQTFTDLGKVKGYLNFDMIGRNTNEAEPEHVVYFYTAAHPVFGDWLKNDLITYGLKLKPDYRAWDKPVGGSDNSSFAKHDIPVIWYHTDGHPDYHQPSDHTEKINWEKTVEITKAAFLNLWNLANERIF